MAVLVSLLVSLHVQQAQTGVNSQVRYATVPTRQVFSLLLLCIQHSQQDPIRLKQSKGIDMLWNPVKDPTDTFAFTFAKAINLCNNKEYRITSY
jgi:hypothetical protein